MSNLHQRHAFGTITADNAADLVSRLLGMLTAERFVVVEYRTTPAVADRPRVLTDKTLSLKTFPYLSSPVCVEGDEITICTVGERWIIPFGSEFYFEENGDQVRFVTKRFDAVRVFRVQEQREDEGE